MIREIVAFIKHNIKAKGPDKIQDPFFKEFYSNTIEDDRMFYAFDLIEEIRSHLEADTREIIISDFGAGSKLNKANKKSIAKIAKSALSSPYQCRVLFRIVEHLSPKFILEIGTSLGISTIYMAFANRNSHLYTLEGDPVISDIASQLFERLSLNNIEIIRGDFEETLTPTLNKINKGSLELAFIDGNHKKEATIDYFEKILPYMGDKGLIIIDDIYWSKPMTDAWNEIKKHPSVQNAIDLYFCGLVFLQNTNKISKSEAWKLGKKLYFLE